MIAPWAYELGKILLEERVQLDALMCLVLESNPCSLD